MNSTRSKSPCFSAFAEIRFLAGSILTPFFLSILKNELPLISFSWFSKVFLEKFLNSYHSKKLSELTIQYVCPWQLDHHHLLQWNHFLSKVFFLQTKLLLKWTLSTTYYIFLQRKTYSSWIDSFTNYDKLDLIRMFFLEPFDNKSAVTNAKKYNLLGPNAQIR